MDVRNAVDEFTPGNADRERRGRVAYERMAAFMPLRSWESQTPMNREQWCHVAEAAFEEGRAFEREYVMQKTRYNFADMANMLRHRGYRVYEPGTWVVADDGTTVWRQLKRAEGCCPE